MRARAFDMPVTPEVRRQARRIAQTLVIGYTSIAVALTAIVLARTTLGLNDSLEDLTQQLMDGGKAGIKNVSWSPPKRG